MAYKRLRSPIEARSRNNIIRPTFKQGIEKTRRSNGNNFASSRYRVIRRLDVDGKFIDRNCYHR